MTESGPEDETLLELGRLTWAAIRLEDVVRVVAGALAPLPEDVIDTKPIGDRINAAKAAAERLHDREDRRRVVEWLTRVSAALDARHSVFHASPVVFFSLPGTTPIPGSTGRKLHHVPAPKKNQPARSPVAHDLTVEGLRPVTRKLQDAFDGRDDLLAGLYDAD